MDHYSAHSSAHAAALETDSEKYLGMAPWTVSNLLKSTKRKAVSDYEVPRKRIRISEEEIHLSHDQKKRLNALKRRLRDGSEKASSPEIGNVFSDNKPPRKRSRISEEEIHLRYDQIKRSNELKRHLRDESEKALFPEIGNIFSDDKPPRKRTRISEEETLPTKHQIQVKLDGFPKRESKSLFSPHFAWALAKSLFKTKYKQQDQLGEGGCGSVYAGYRRFDKLPVAIKHVPKKNVVWTDADENGWQLSTEVAAMLKLETERDRSIGRSAPISLLDWYNLKKELILVLERPVPAVDLLKYIEKNKKPLDENQAKIIIKQLVHAAKHLEDNKIFHRDIKPENILIETGSEMPRLRLIDFGLSCFTDQTSDGCFYGTERFVPAEWLSEGVYDAGPATVWQVGAVLYETLHKKEFNSVKFVKNKQTISKRLSRDCRSFLQKCLTKNSGRRPTLEELQHHPWICENTGSVQ
ncbi:serine/threonine-protein kinase pim-1-like [Nothobranchius furzeri]|uniref:serine/threonine-protein kinase pim-1-like n=1 Tax=Nothobranchius furzeri TaxID=105023 RepID=UPI003904AC5B